MSSTLWTYLLTANRQLTAANLIIGRKNVKTITPITQNAIVFKAKKGTGGDASGTTTRSLIYGMKLRISQPELSDLCITNAIVVQTFFGIGHTLAMHANAVGHSVIQIFLSERSVLEARPWSGAYHREQRNRQKEPDSYTYGSEYR